MQKDMSINDLFSCIQCMMNKLKFLVERRIKLFPVDYNHSFRYVNYWKFILVCWEIQSLR